jgi:trans-2-enoyl-CoA reductase
VTPPPLPLQTTGGANAELLAGENAATFAETPVTDDKRGDGGPTVEQAGQQAAQDIGVAVEQGRRQTPGEEMKQRGFPNIRTELKQVGEDADSLMASMDRLPVVGIRKARTRRVLIV